MNAATPLENQKIVLTSSKNKSELIKFLCQTMRDRAATFCFEHSLVVSADGRAPFEISQGRVFQRYVPSR